MQRTRRLTFRAAALPVLLAAAASTAGCFSYKEHRVAQIGIGPASRYEGELPPVFAAADLLPAGLLKGRYHEVVADVPVMEYHLLFIIRTPQGDIRALGRNMLELRLRELRAAELAIDLADRHKVFPDVRAEVIKLFDRAVPVLADPVGAHATQPEALLVDAGDELDATGRRAGSPYRRKLAAALGCDPGTYNPLLRGLLDALAGKTQLSDAQLAAIPANNVRVSGVLDGEGEALRFFAAHTPEETVAEIRSRLKSAGAPDAAVDRFVANPSSTLAEKLVASAVAARLKGIENAGEALSHAGEVRNEITSLNRLAAVQRLAAEHERNPIVQLRIGTAIGARHKDGGVTVLLPGDYMTATKELEDLVAAFRRKNPDAPARVFALGAVSAQARKLLEDAKFTVIETAPIGRKP